MVDSRPRLDSWLCLTDVRSGWDASCQDGRSRFELTAGLTDNIAQGSMPTRAGRRQLVTRWAWHETCSELTRGSTDIHTTVRQFSEVVKCIY